MQTTSATEPSETGRTTEDWHSASDTLIVVLDGATARTDTGCIHGTAWYTQRLGIALTTLAGDLNRGLPDILATAIETVAAEHPDCDLTHPGTPSAAVGVLRSNGHDLEYILLGDVTIVLDDTTTGATAVVDSRVETTARAERDAADRLPIDAPEKLNVLVRMKHAELAARNTVDGYWVASADPGAAAHAITGSRPASRVRRAAVLTDGAARAVTPFALLDWPGLLDLMEEATPRALLRLVREAEASDPDGGRWPRNKRSDDATAVFAKIFDRLRELA